MSMNCRLKQSLKFVILTVFLYAAYVRSNKEGLKYRSIPIIYRLIINLLNDQLPADLSTAARALHQHSKGQGSNPVQAWIFQAFLITT